MTIHIIHLPHRNDRYKLLLKELESQHIKDFRIWEGIVDTEIISRGISRAHKQIVRHAKALQLPDVLIAEDDLHFTAPGAFQYFLDNKPVDYDIYLGGITWGWIGENNEVNDFSGITLYMVNENFFDRFLSIPADKDLDRQLRHKGKFIVCNPMVVIQHDGFSDNHKRYFSFKAILNSPMYKFF